MPNSNNKWTKNIEEISNGVWKVTMIHQQGAIAEKTGTNLEQLQIEVEGFTKELEKEINKIVLNKS